MSAAAASVMHAACLGEYGLVVGVVAPAWLSRVAASGYAPRLGIAAWLVAIATVMGSWLAAVVIMVRSAGMAFVLLGWVLLAAGGVRVGWAVWVTCRAVRARRAAHRQMLALLGRPDPERGVVAVEAVEPLMYCLPPPDAMVVVTSAARQLLSGRQFRAALAHERAHLTGRHHLLTALVSALGRAVPWLPVFTQAQLALADLLEMRADDVAARAHGRYTVAAAIAALGRQSVPAGTLGAAGGSPLLRGLRMCRAEPDWRVRVSKVVLAVTVAVLAISPYLSSAAPWCPHPWW